MKEKLNKTEAGCRVEENKEIYTLEIKKIQKRKGAKLTVTFCMDKILKLQFTELKITQPGELNSKNTKLRIKIKKIRTRIQNNDDDDTLMTYLGSRFTIYKQDKQCRYSFSRKLVLYIIFIYLLFIIN